MEGTQVSFPKPGRSLKVMLALLAIVGITGGLLFNYGPKGVFEYLVVLPGQVLHRPWTVLTGPLVTNPTSWGHLIFSLLGLYFLGPALERSWGAARFVRFVILSVLGGTGLALLLAAIAPESVRAFHPDLMMGPGAAMAALAVAWGREHPDTQIRLFFFLPISGRAFVWITLGFCVLGLVYPSGIPEGVAAPFGGFVTGLLLSGTPSPLRSLYLRAKLGFLRRKNPAVRIDLEGRPSGPKRARPGAPPLRVVQGGLDEDLAKRQPPKDKRYLN
jgi:membrane associated rhomboid family serine protease